MEIFFMGYELHFPKSQWLLYSSVFLEMPGAILFLMYLFFGFCIALPSILA